MRLEQKNIFSLKKIAKEIKTAGGNKIEGLDNLFASLDMLKKTW